MPFLFHSPPMFPSLVPSHSLLLLHPLLLFPLPHLFLSQGRVAQARTTDV
ncbi:hypothetical protein E2C01_012074 [Portunus trituberculatus]|uniref:Uncharacterized protein n=1 Tax=Portunus trituberculatus TaxID=210409 RepID=A0A5B7DDN0_PORTR|nr:hypothetical protein [Portunus trituberculatus]